MKTISERDKHLIWHPFTQEKLSGLHLPIVRGEGPYLYDEHGRSYLDLISSWWVNLHGHANPIISEAIYKQSLSLEHVIFAGFTHEPAVVLCESLSSILPSFLNKFFFSDNGSTAVEIALKMSYQYWHNKGKKGKRLFLSFDGGYHGDTFGAMSVGKKCGFHGPFKDFLFNVLHIPYPHTWQGDENVLEKEEESLNMLEATLQENADNIAAMIIEPLVQGAMGMRMSRASFVIKVIKLLKKYDVLVILDEVMTGFGRTGKNFAYDHLNEEVDFICLSKGITGGFLPLALTVTADNIYQAFLSDGWDKAFAHGHSYTANPIACAAAVASFNILVNSQTQQNIKMICDVHLDSMLYLDKKYVKNIRFQGTIAAFDVEQEVVGWLQKSLLQEGLLVRPLDNTFYLLSPYCVSESELRDAYKLINEKLHSYYSNKK